MRQRDMRWITLGIILLTGLTACNFTFDDDASATALPSTEVQATIPATVGTELPTTAFVRITNPVPQNDGTPPVVSAVSLTVSGEQFGSFENNIVVEVHSSDGMVLDQVAVTAFGDMGTIGTWEATLSPNATPGSSGVIYAYFTSARDGSIVAEDRVNINFTTSEG